MKVDFYWHSYKYLPYEKELALRELKALNGVEPKQKTNTAVSVYSSAKWKTSACNITYFMKGVGEDGSTIMPIQTLLEASASTINSLESYKPFRSEVSLQRQSTRYSAHGIHEYRGKFNPQIVRAIGNIIGLKPKDWVLDPFCGCGTTLLESAHIGWNAIGIDLNPLGVIISDAKIAALKIPASILNSQIQILESKLLKLSKGLSFDQAFSQIQMLGITKNNWQADFEYHDYLRKWFKESVLAQLSAIVTHIDSLPSKEVQTILRVILSDILREVSLQDAADLRIRRRKSPAENLPVIPLFLNSMKRKVQTILRAREFIPHIETTQRALLGDAKYCSDLIRKNPEFESVKFNAAITSPPYSTALPYIDMHRLSLVFLGLVTPREIHSLERSLVGNREITRKHRQQIEQNIEKNSSNLPIECVAFCSEMKKAVNSKTDGFRKQDKPALVYEYLSNMATMFEQVYQLLQEGAIYALIVGKNTSVLGGKSFVINTPEHLSLIAQSKGFDVEEIIELDTYQRFDIHKENSIRSEDLLLLRKA